MLTIMSAFAQIERDQLAERTKAGMTAAAENGRKAGRQEVTTEHAKVKSASAKTAAMADISRLTQALVRGKAWAVLDKSIVAQVSKQFAKKFAIRLTKQGLDKVLPLAGIAIGGAFNWATLESIVDAAGIAYRGRFLLEKYPHLADEEVHGPFPDMGQEDSDGADEVISVLDELAEMGGPDLHITQDTSQ